MISRLRTIEKTIAAIGFGSAFILLPLIVGMRTYEIVARKLWQAPSNLLQAIEGEALITVTFLTLAYAYLHDSHVRVDVLRDRLSRKAQVWIEAVGLLIFMTPLSAIVIWYGVDFAAISYDDGERAAFTLGGPFGWAIKATLPFGIGLLSLAMITKNIRQLMEIHHPSSRRNFEDFS